MELSLSLSLSLSLVCVCVCVYGVLRRVLVFSQCPVCCVDRVCVCVCVCVWGGGALRGLQAARIQGAGRRGGLLLHRHWQNLFFPACRGGRDT